MNLLLSFILGLFLSMGKSEASEEELLQRKAVLVARKVYLKNLNLIGVDPESCKAVDNSKLILKQIGQLKQGGLSHCSQFAEEKIHSLNEEIKQLENGVLIYRKLSINRPETPEFVLMKPEIGPVEEIQQKDVELVPSVDSTGLTSEQKEYILDSYKRNERNYTPNELDSIFQILSKAYIRNLEKILQIP